MNMPPRTNSVLYSVQPILEYIDAQYDVYYETERTATFRRQINDTRVHMCLYFIQPTGHQYVHPVALYGCVHGSLRFLV